MNNPSDKAWKGGGIVKFCDGVKPFDGFGTKNLA